MKNSVGADIGRGICRKCRLHALALWYGVFTFCNDPRKRNMLKIWNIVLIIITFGLSILGTFIVRSGVINSVHSFAQSEIGPAFLVFLAIVLFVGFTFLFYRLKELESPNTIESIVCKENVFLTQNILFVGIAFTVLLGTTFPLLAEAIKGTKLSIQAPFFNTITAPMGYAIFFLMGIGTLIAWRRSTLDNFKRNFIKPIVIATLGTMGLLFFCTTLRSLIDPLDCDFCHNDHRV